MFCPTCKHPVIEHKEYFCEHPNCYCNSSYNTAEARYWACYYKEIADERKEALRHLIKEHVEMHKLLEKLER